MVQTHNSTQLRSQPQHYWKVHVVKDASRENFRYRLANTGSSVAKLCMEADGTRLPVMDSRAQRGMLLYEKCSVAELRTFCVRRGILSHSVRVLKPVLVYLLEAADEDFVFRFGDLPPELRLRIYQYSFQFFRDETREDSQRDLYQGYRYFPRYEIVNGRRAVAYYSSNNQPRCNVFKLPPPPIACTCRLFRREARPLFYEKGVLYADMYAIPATDTPFKLEFKYELAPKVRRQVYSSPNLPFELRKVVRKLSITFFHCKVDGSLEQEEGTSYGRRITSTVLLSLQDIARPCTIVEAVPSVPAIGYTPAGDSLSQAVLDDLQHKVGGMRPEHWMDALQTQSSKSEAI